MSRKCFFEMLRLKRSLCTCIEELVKDEEFMGRVLAAGESCLPQWLQAVLEGMGDGEVGKMVADKMVNMVCRRHGPGGG